MQNSRFRFAWALCFCLVIFPASLRAMKVGEVPNPQVTSRSFVQDSGGMLGPDYVSRIDQLAKQLEGQTSAEMAVVTIDNLGDLTVEDFAVELFKQWGIGKKGKDNGILILIARDNRRFRVEVGYGLEGALPDARAKRLIEEIAVPLYKKGQFGQGTLLLAKAIAEIVAKEDGKSFSFQTADDSLPAQPALPTPTEPQDNAGAEPPPARDPALFFIEPRSYFFWAILFTSLWSLQKWLRASRDHSRAGKLKIAGKDILGFGTTIFVAGGLFTLFWSAFFRGPFIITLMSYLGGNIFSTFLASQLQKILRRNAENYHRPCSKCQAKMNIVPEAADDRFLSVEEVAEEKAGGMDYEFWECPACKNVERINVTLPDASSCAKCLRRTLKKTEQTLVAASTVAAGVKLVQESCKNPKCNYHNEWRMTIPKIVPVSSSGGGSSSSGGGSFGGGSSGGGGASGGW